MKIEVVLAEPADAEILADISKRAFDSDIDVGAPGPGGPEGYDDVEAHRRDTKSDRIDYWKVVVDGKIAGGTRLYPVSSYHFYIFGVFVDPDFHGQGIGSEFFRIIESNYPDAKKWSLDTPEWNVRTKGFYEKVGFVQTGVLRWVPVFELRYYVKIADDYQEDYTSISKLHDGMKGIMVQGTVEAITSTKDVTSKDGKELKVANATICDDSGSVTLVLWNDMIRQVREGERIVVGHCHISVFGGQMQLNISRGGQILILQSS